jgi:hypothetical protein
LLLLFGELKLLSLSSGGALGGLINNMMKRESINSQIWNRKRRLET